MASQHDKIALIGSGTIGLSFAALHLTKNPKAIVTIFDTRPDLQEYVWSKLPSYLLDADQQQCMNRLDFAHSLSEAVQHADIVQEQGPEDLAFKVGLWPQVEKHAPKDALLWSSTSGIKASLQLQDMEDQSRLIVSHPFNPPHLMPIIELVPSPQTSQSVIDRTLEYWRKLGRNPVVIKKECTGFVANRLAFALFKEACSLVADGVVTVEELDSIVTASSGPRWSVAGPFKAYHAGGGDGGLRSFLDKIGGTVQECWDASEDDVRKGHIAVGGKWQEEVCRQADEAYGVVDTAERDRRTRLVLKASAGPE